MTANSSWPPIKAARRVEGRSQDEAFCDANERRRLGGDFAYVGFNGGSDRSPIRRQNERLGEPLSSHASASHGKPDRRHSAYSYTRHHSISQARSYAQLGSYLYSHSAPMPTLDPPLASTPV